MSVPHHVAEAGVRIPPRRTPPHPAEAGPPFPAEVGPRSAQSKTTVR
ncbi:hypothetical protein [Brevibacterium casei]|nr:hypothetical protein [Brevibacterium casei]MCT2209448.1 hypothetical protein [Brevibacterium casei]